MMLLAEQAPEEVNGVLFWVWSLSKRHSHGASPTVRQLPGMEDQGRPREACVKERLEKNSEDKFDLFLF